MGWMSPVIADENDLPALPPLTLATDQLSTLGQFEVNHFVFSGNTVFTDDELQQQIKTYENREITAEELQNARYILTQFYVKQGYINSGAIIPDQKINDSHNIVINIIEGHLRDINVTGVSYVSNDYIVRRLDYSPDIVLNQNDLQQRLQLLQQNPLVDLFNAELGPGLKLGDAVLNLGISEPKRPYDLKLSFNNHRAPSVGAYRAELEGTHYSVTGHGDRLQVRLGLTQGLKDYSFDYTVPLSFKQMEWSIFSNRSDSSVISTPFNQLDIKSDSQTYGTKLKYPLFNQYKNNRYRTLDLALSMEKRRSSTSLLGRPYTFSVGAKEGVSRLSVVRFSQTWQDRTAAQVLSAYSNFSLGIDSMNATINSGGIPDGEFFSWQGQFNWIRRLPQVLQSQLSLRMGLQLTADRLLPLEKFSLGGVSTVRGYRENQFTFDRGWSASLEWQIPVYYTHLLSKQNQGTGKYGQIYVAPFVDYGHGTNVGSDNSETIYSAGLGLLWVPNNNINARIYWGKTFKDLPENDDHDLQDEGIHFSLSITY